MAVLDVLKMGNPILNQIAEPVSKFDKQLKKLAKDMIDTMIIEDGIGLAAPQVGQSIRMIVIDLSLIDESLEPTAYVNPEIVERDGDFVYEEGCLSVPGIREEVNRSKHIRVNYQDLDGKSHSLEAEDLLAVVFQHEIDHLNGILFVQKLSPIKQKLLNDQIKQIKETSVY
ncbi:MAG: peptide deformylase [Calditrichaeota bacterium]|nr:peptide deformylase [Calditrichota bacterium]